MKTTTKILFFVIGGIFLLTIVYFSVLPVLFKQLKEPVLDGRVVERNVPDCPFLKIEEPAYQISENVAQFSEVLLKITTSSDSLQWGKLVLPVELDSCVITEQKGDTLVVRFSNLKKLEKGQKIYLLKEMVLQYYAKSLRAVENTSIARLHFEGFRSGTALQIAAKEEVRFSDSCSLTVLQVEGAGSLGMENCQMDTLNLNLDRIGNWRVRNCEIQVENLKAGGRPNVYVPVSEAAEINWHPQGDGARLSITLSNTPAQIRYEKKEKE